MALRPPGSAFSVARRLSERARAQRSEAAASEPPPDTLTGLSGLSGMLDALRGLVDRLADPANAEEQASEGHVSIGGSGARLVFGYTLRMGEDGISAERFGDVPAPRRDRTAPEAPARQPIAEVYEEGDEIVVVAELPGADPQRITCTVEAGALSIEAGGVHRYRKSLPLPAPVVCEGLRRSFQNGILEVRLRREERA